MEKIGIIADTSQDFTFDLAKEYDIKIVPYTVHMGNDNFKDLVELDKETFYQKIDEVDSVGTSTPDIHTVVQAIKDLENEGCTQILAITSSSDMTGMANLYESINHMEMNLPIKVFDGGQIGSAGALLAIEASKLRNKGLSIEQIYDRLVDLRPNANIYALFRNLKYLVAGGRISRAKGAIGGLLGVSPILTMASKKVGLVEKVRGNKRSLDRFIEILRERVGSSTDYDLILFHGANPVEFAFLKEAVSDLIDKATLYIETVMTPVLGAHTGPITVGFSILNRN